MFCVRAAATRRFYCAAVVSASITVGVNSQAAAAAYYYWTDSDPGIYRPERPAPQRRQKPHHNQAKTSAAEKEASKPQGSLIVAVSVNRQQVKIYDANGVFAQAPVSTGMKGHATPLGVFSVIQKQKFHRSNIYSGAPMPFMQRITWSGVALHAGVLPGYPASHGCIRMPPGFAVKMYGWTRMGARVLVTAGEVAPSSFSHPLLASLKAPPPTASAQPDASPPAAPGKTDKGALLGTPVTVGAALDLRTSIGPADAAIVAEPGSAPRRGQTQTANAGSTAAGAATVSDALPVTAARVTTDAMVAESGVTTAPEIPTRPGNAAHAPAADKPAPAEASTAKPDNAAAVQTAEQPADAKTPETGAAETKAPATDAADTPADAAKADDEPADAKKDQTRLSGSDKLAPVKPELKRNSQIAIFISRKDSKLYVRQNFAPVFNTPVTIAPSERPLGTHLFTATADKTDPATMQWSVVTLPQRGSARNDDGEKVSRRGKRSADAQAEIKPVPDSPAEALDRITIPADVVAWLGEALSSGSSLIISDQGINQGETGEGTEFILSLR
jgi:lipoprotein-anchoring transpeptidase ErfK/SrfK